MDLNRFMDVYNEENLKRNSEKQYAEKFCNDVQSYWKQYILTTIDNISSNYLDNSIVAKIQENPDSVQYTLEQRIVNPKIFRDAIVYNNKDNNNSHDLWLNENMKVECKNIDYKAISIYRTSNYYSSDYPTFNIALDLKTMKNFFNSEVSARLKTKLTSYGAQVLNICFSENYAFIYVTIKNPCIGSK